MKTFGKMLKLEGRLSVRDMNMLIFAELMPLVILILIGIIYGKKKLFRERIIPFWSNLLAVYAALQSVPEDLWAYPL